MFNTRAPGEVTGTTRLKVRVENLTASPLDESSGKVLSADHDNQAELRDLTVPITSFRDSERPEAEGRRDLMVPITSLSR